MPPIRLGTVEFLNTAPLVEGLAHTDGVSLVRAVPSRIIDLLTAGEVDLGLVSLVDLARAPEPLAMLPVGMIGCDGPTLTVRVYSAVPIDRIARLHADADSHTSVVLARLLLNRLHAVRPELVAYDAREQMPRPGDESGDWPESLLLIGDKVVSASPPAVRYPHQLDLGQAWHDLTGLPFVYAVWACPADRAEDPDVLAAAALLDRTRRRNALRLDHIVNRRASRHAWPTDLARDYLGRLLRYDFDERALRATERFLTMAADDGLLPASKPNLAKIPEIVPTPG